MAVLQTQKIHICALKSSRKQILEELQRTGAVQIEQGAEEDSVFRKMDTAPGRSKFEKCARNAEESLRVLESYSPEKKSMFASLEGKKEISKEQYEQQAKDRKRVREMTERILALQKRIAEDQAGIVRTEAALESLVPWMSLDVPMNFKGTKTTGAFIGTMPGHWTLEQTLSAVAQAHPELEAYSIEVLGADRDQTCIFAVCAKKDADALEDALRVNGFVKPALQSDLTPEAYSEQLKKEKASCQSSEKEAEDEIRSFAGHRDEIRFLADYYRMRAEKYRVLGELLQSGHVFFVDGYVPEYCASELKNRLEQEYTCEAELSEVPAEEDAPVLLKNNAFAEPTESVVESFGLPNKGEIDPTSIMAFFYYFLFGLMLSDAGYGILMVIVCAAAVKKFPKMDAGLKKMLKMFFFSGISTTCWGILFGSYFGDVVTVVASTFFGKDITVPALWFVPLDEPMRLLLYSFLFGLIHLFVGLGIKGYMLIRDKKYVDFFANVLCWYVLIVALILMLLPSSIFASLSGAVIVFPSWVGVLTKWMAIVSAVGIVLFSENGRKNIALRIAMGAYDLYGISSWLSDVLSYSRLLALGLATGVIASVINTMGSMVGSGVIGFIVFWIIFLVGHTLNMAINLLGAYVHTNRLQFVEFFGKFYEGGGRAFRPFSVAANKYFKFKEEK